MKALYINNIINLRNMKKYFRFALMAALTVGLSLAATSCKDDDKDSEQWERQRRADG